MLDYDAVDGVRVNPLRIRSRGLYPGGAFASVEVRQLNKERKSIMLTLTESATTAVKAIIDGTPDVAGGGLRIGQGSDDNPGFAVSVVARPEPGDSTVESDGAKVFLEPAASAVLDDKTLDAQMTDGSVTFALVPQVA